MEFCSCVVFASKEWSEARLAAEETLQAFPSHPEAMHFLRQINYQEQLHLRQQKELHRRMMMKSAKNLRKESPKKELRAAPPQRVLHSCVDSVWMPEVKWMPEDYDVSLWSEPQTLQTLEEECNFTLTRSLPLTMLYAMAELAKLTETTRDSEASSASTNLQLPNLKRKVLCLHILGASARRDLSCRYTALLQRLPEVETLILVFVGFNNASKSECKFERDLEAGRLSPPQMIKFEGREQVAVFFKGSYKELTAAVPGILNDEKCSLFPHVAVYSSPSPLDTDLRETLTLLTRHRVLTVVTQSIAFALDESLSPSEALASVATKAGGNGLLRLAEEQVEAQVLFGPAPSAFPQLLQLPSWRASASSVATAEAENSRKTRMAEGLALAAVNAAASGKTGLAAETQSEEAHCRVEAEASAAKAVALFAHAEADHQLDQEKKTQGGDKQEQEKEQEKEKTEEKTGLRGAGVHASFFVFYGSRRDSSKLAN